MSHSTPEANSKAKNIIWHHASVNRQERAAKLGHKSAILWFTGLSGSGKSTVANAVNLALFEKGIASYVLDGDNIRHGLCKDLGFSDLDREENIRRIGEVAKLFLDAGIIVLTAFVSPFRADREKARSLVKKQEFFEIYCAADLETCEKRDPKGLYAKARTGEIKDFTGISSPYEEPLKPEIALNTGTQQLHNCVEFVLDNLKTNQVIS